MLILFKLYYDNELQWDSYNDSTVNLIKTKHDRVTE